jgi:predicted RNase H-like nuclease (RuvC/YqgF family)
MDQVELERRCKNQAKVVRKLRRENANLRKRIKGETGLAEGDVRVVSVRRNDDLKVEPWKDSKGNHVGHVVSNLFRNLGEPEKFMQDLNRVLSMSKR